MIVEIRPAEAHDYRVLVAQLAAPLRIAIVSDDRLFCESLAQLLAEDPSLAVTAYSDVLALNVLRAGNHQIAICDARMTDALTSWATIARDGGPHVILVGAPDDDDWAGKALTAGARGILTKTSPSTDVIKAIRIVNQGGIWACRRWLNAWVLRLAPAPPERAGEGLNRLLSRREREVFQYAAMGMANKAVAERLEISEATVKVHLTHIFKKLGVGSRAELAAAYHGLARDSIADRNDLRGRARFSATQ